MLAQKGSYYGNPIDAADFCAIQLETTNSFSNNNEAQIALNKVINVLGISQRFAIYQCNGIDNCVAVTIRGIRYIFYDTYFMKEISNNANSYWTNLSILAHEIGHHINGHTVDVLAYMTGEIEPISLAEKRQQEIEADEISGYVLYKLGATLYQAQQAINSISLDGDDTYSTHPNKTKRLNAIKIGYEKAKSQSSYVFDNASTNNSPLTADDYFYLAYNNEIDYQYSIENYTKCLRMQPNNSVAFNNRGINYHKQGNNKTAIEDFSSAIKINPNYDAAFYNRGVCNGELGNDKVSIVDYTNAIKINPKFTFAYYNRGFAYDKLENYKAAIEDFTRAININTEFDNAYFKRGNVYKKLKNYDAAIKDFTYAIKINPNYSDAFFSRGNTYHILKNFEVAIEDFSSAININPNYDDAYLNRGVAYHLLGDEKAAITDFNSAIRINPNNENAIFNRGFAYTMTKNYSSAIVDFSSVIRLNPNYGKAYQMRGYAKEKAGQYYETDYKKACELGIKECCN